ncbi:MAG: N-acetylmuramic acid 6-phosphate etherase [Planctomycetota bacterium]
MTEPDLSRLATEERNPATTGLDRMTPTEFVAVAHREDRAAVAAVERALPQVARAIAAVAERMQRGGRLIYVGAGTSGRLGVLDAAECPPTFSVGDGVVCGVIAGGERAFTKAVEGAEDDAQLGADDLQRLAVSADDCVVGITASGRTPYVLGALRAARAAGALTLGLVCSHGSAVAAAADIGLEVLVGPEILTGSTRLKAGTATKLVLNMLSTGVMVQLGKCYENLMVDVQASNDKLRARARRIVAQATGRDEGAAATLLAQCGGEVKTAIVVGLAGVDPARARAALQRHGGRVRAAVADR